MARPDDRVEGRLASSGLRADDATCVAWLMRRNESLAKTEPDRLRR